MSKPYLTVRTRVSMPWWMSFLGKYIRLETVTFDANGRVIEPFETRVTYGQLNADFYPEWIGEESK